MNVGEGGSERVLDVAGDPSELRDLLAGSEAAGVEV